jgi:hypothetical protein
LDSPSSPTPRKPTAGLLKNPGEQMNGLISFYIGTVVDLSRERFEVLRNSALRVVSAGRSYLLVGRHFVAIARTRWWKNKVLNVLSTDSGEDGRIVFNRICFYKEYTAAMELAIGSRDAELLDEEVLKIILPHLDFRLMDNAFRPM